MYPMFNFTTVTSLITLGADKVMGGDLSTIDHYAVQVSGQ